MGAEFGSVEGDTLDILVTLVEAYEEKHHPILPPDPIEAILHYLEPYLGTQVSDVLSRKRPLSLPMIRSLNEGLGISANILVKSYPLEPAPNPALDSTLVAGLDIGLSNLATVTSNKRGFQPLVVNGRPLKAINQFYNKRKAELQSKLTGNRRTSNRINHLSGKRNRKVKHYLHMASRRLIDHLVDEGVGVLVIGRNKGWKQSINIGKANNQSFVQLPFAQFIQMLTYKAKLAGIQVRLQEESYTSKCSFLDHEPIQKQTPYQGQRIKRGLFRTATGRLINADVNGSYNIIKKSNPRSVSRGRDRGYCSTSVAAYPRINGSKYFTIFWVTVKSQYISTLGS